MKNDAQGGGGRRGRILAPRAGEKIPPRRRRQQTF